MRRNHLLCAALVAGCIASSAHAGQRPFSFVYDTDVVPEGDVELEQWLWARGPSHAPLWNQSLYYLWWSPIIGVGEHLELALPFQLVDDGHDIQGGSANIDFVSVEARWRFKARNNDDWFQMLARVAAIQPVEHYGPRRLELDLVGSIGNRKSLHATLDVGGQFASGHIKDSTADVFGVGSVAVGLAAPLPGAEWQLGAEIFGEFGGSQDADTADPIHTTLTPYPWLYDFPQLYAGPDVAFTRGRVWITASALVGIGGNSAQWLARLTWAVAL